MRSAATGVAPHPTNEISEANRVTALARIEGAEAAPATTVA